MKEEEILDKALNVIDDALSGRVIDPNALDTAIKMTQFFWMSVYSEKIKQEQIKDALRNDFSEEIKDKENPF